MEAAPQIVVVGSHAPGVFVRVERIPVAGETVLGWDYQEPEDGGKGSNQAIAAARLGARTSFVGCLGKDRLGQEALRWLTEAGVDVRFAAFSDTHSTGVGLIILNAAGVPAMVTSMGANEELDYSQVDAALDALKSARVLLTQFEIPPKVALHAAARARQHGMIAVLNPAPAAALPLADLGAAHVIIPNETEAKFLLGIDLSAAFDPVQAARELRAQSHVDCAILTLGEHGIVGCDASGAWTANPPTVRAVDTSGAGDAFCGAFSVGLAQGLRYQAASEWACQAAALSVARPGTIPSFPTLESLNAFIGRAH